MLNYIKTNNLNDAKNIYLGSWRLGKGFTLT